MYMKKWQVFGVALTASLVMIALYLYRGAASLLAADPEIAGFGAALTQVAGNTQHLAMAATQAVFIIFFSMFAAAMAEMILKVRDSMR